jgi:hypothetical protein
MVTENIPRRTSQEAVQRKYHINKEEEQDDVE